MAATSIANMLIVYGVQKLMYEWNEWCGESLQKAKFNCSFLTSLRIISARLQLSRRSWCFAH